MTTEVKCMNCDKDIMPSKENDIIALFAPLSEEDRKSEILSIIEHPQSAKISTGICINCSLEYLSLIKEKLNEEEEKHENCVNSMKDLLLDISNKKEVYNILDSNLNKSDIGHLEKETKDLYKERIDLENKIKEKKSKLRQLIDEEHKILSVINNNKKKEEENKEIKEKLIMKRDYLKKLYQQMIKE